MCTLSRRRLSALASTLVALPLLWACDNLSPLSPAQPNTSAAVVPIAHGLLVICKFGTAATFNVAITGGSTTTVSVADGECKTVANEPTAFPLKTATVSEVAQPSVIQLDSIRQDTLVGATIFSRKITGTNSVTTSFGLEVGSTLSFFNRPVVQNPSLSITKTGSGTTNAGDTIRFTVTVTSNGPGTATGVTLNDPLPGGGGVSWLIGSQPAGNPCSITGSAPSQTLACTFGDLAAGVSRAVSVKSGTTTASCGTYPNTASASATNHATVTANATDTVNCPPPPGNDGCTPGFWKQEQHFAFWTAPFTPTTLIKAVFNTGTYTTFKSGVVIGDQTLLDGLEFKGGSTVGGAVEILIRAAVAAVLNDANPNVNYPLSVATIVSQVNAAIATGDRDTILALAGTLDGFNNGGCTAK